MGIKVLPPDVNESDAEYTPRGTDIRFGLTAVRNVGAHVVDSIIATRTSKGRFTDFQDFISKVEISVCNRRVVESLIKAGAFDALGHTRKGLVTVHEGIIDSAVELKRAEAIGQFDLFGGLGSETEGGSLTSTEIPISEWEKSVLLAHEREMLGLYVSDHPLIGLESLLAQATDRSIASIVMDDKLESSTAVIGGLVTSVQRKTTKKGSPWAIVSLEDLEGSLEVMVFPQTYAQVGVHLVDDAILIMKVRADRDDDELRVVAFEVSVPDVSDAVSGPVKLSVAATRCVPPLVERLKEILAAHPGSTEVHLHLTGGAHTTVLALDAALRVAPSPALYADLKALLGPTCLSA
jgi:DNA polymerase-3 subunit alpha